jgi:copper chaperone CopZ
MERIMKRAFRFLTVAFVALVLIVGLTTAKDNNVIIPSNEITIKTSAFSWMCKNKIETNVLKMNGVMDCEVDLATKTITVKLDPENITNISILNKIEDLGYEAELQKEKSIE